MAGLTRDQFQGIFKVARERTSSSAADLHYTLWKVMSESNGLAEILCVTMSVLFTYGFVCERWLKEIDMMLKKKKGIHKIYTLQIIGLLEADFNLALKFYFIKEIMERSEENRPLDNKQ